MPLAAWVLVVVCLILAFSWFTSMIWFVVKVIMFIFLAALAYEVVKRFIQGDGDDGRGGPPVAPA